MGVGAEKSFFWEGKRGVINAAAAAWIKKVDFLGPPLARTNFVRYTCPKKKGTFLAFALYSTHIQLGT